MCSGMEASITKSLGQSGLSCGWDFKKEEEIA